MLVVDDEPVLRCTIADILRDEGYRVDEAPNGAIGLEVALTSRPDVVVFDWAMPVVDGRGLVEAIRESMRPLPELVAVSAVREARAWCADNGVPIVVTKPFDDVTLVKAVDSALVRVRENRQPRSREVKSGTRAIVRPACVVAVGGESDESLQESLPESLRHARIVAVRKPEDAERILEMIVPDLLIIDDDVAHATLRLRATRKGVPVLVRPGPMPEAVAR